jgi:surface polysaccharide O-acyltransferase-like enzyme
MSIPKVQYLDNLRVIATLAVLLIHSAANVLLNFGKIPDSAWWFANLYNGGFRYAVPIFVMLSGALLLPREEEIGSFLKKKFSKNHHPFSLLQFDFRDFQLASSSKWSLTKFSVGF